MAAILTAAMVTGALGSPHYSLVPKDIDANLRFRRDVLTMAGRDPATARQLVQMSAEDMLFYVNVFGWTYDPRSSQSVVPFVTYDFQDEAMTTVAKCVVNGHDFAIPKSRDMGASWLGLTVYEWFWHFRYDLSFLLISRNEDYVDKKGNPKSLFWKIDFLHEHQPKWLLPSGRELGWDDPNRKLLHLGNADTRSVIDGESTTGDAGRGDRRTAMFIDEHAAFELNDGFRVLRATRDTTKCRGFNSTPQGANNGFYEVVHNTAARQIRLHWTVHPEKNKGLYTTENGKLKRMDDFSGMVDVRQKGEKDIRRVKFPEDYPFKLDGKMRAPWYDNECARCISEVEVAQELDINFMGSDYQFFDPDTISMLRKKYCRPPLLVGDLEFDNETCEPKRFVENPKGKLAMWLTLGADGRPARDRHFVLGADISAGTGASNSVSCVVDKATGEKCAVWKDPNTLPHPFARLTMALARFFNRAMIVPDRSGPTGEVAVREMVKQGNCPLYYRRLDRKVGRDVTDEPGMFLNPAARSALLEDYRDALGNHRYINRSDAGMQECLQFIRRQDGTLEHSASANSQDPSGARSAHGDEVIADALACLGMTDTQSERQPDEPSIPPGCLAARMKARADAEAEKSRDQLGEGWAA
jgi:hypothetical protein